VARDTEFAAFVVARYRALVRTGLLITGDAGHAENLAQSALIRTYLAWSGLRDPASGEAYARRTLVRLALRARRPGSAGEIASGPSPGSATSAAAVPGLPDLAMDVRRALAALPAGQRAVLVLRYLDDQSEAETARVLGISPGTVKSRAASGLAGLRQAGLLDSEGGRHHERIRSLLSLAADLPDNVQAPLTRVLDRARHRRLRAAASVAAAAVIAGAAVTLSAVLGSPGRGTADGSHKRPVVAGPTAGQLARYHWAWLPPSPLGARTDPLLKWTGRYLIELGGWKDRHLTEDGAVYDAESQRWRRIPTVTSNVGFSNAVAAWTGRQLFVANGQFASCLGGAPDAPCLPHAGLYDPAANRWKFMLLPRPLDGLTLEGAAWTGRDIVLAGVGTHARFRVAAYAPATGHWRMITPKLPAGRTPAFVTMLGTPGRVLLWDFWNRATTSSTGSVVNGRVTVLALARSGRWTDVTGRWPQAETVVTPVYAGGHIFYWSSIWCGPCGPPAFSQEHLVTSATLTPVMVKPSPLRPADGWVWTGASLLAGGNGPGGRPAMAAYDPGARRWHLVPQSPGRLFSDSLLTWADRQLLALTSAGALWTFRR
jgi:RNA polymerase sigma-70 factor (sigma-E family)